MTNKQQSKVRFVRCPKCTKILPEPEHIPLYACGGCGAILQAKNYKGPEIYTALSSHEQDVKRNGINHTCYAGESSGSSRRSSSDHSSAQEEGRSSNCVENSRNSEENGAASSFDYSSLPKKQENGEIKDSKSDHDGSANHAHHTSLSKESGCAENKENGDTYRQIDQLDSKDRGAYDHSSFLEKETWKLTGANSAVKDDNGEDEECNCILIEKLHQKHLGGMNGERERFTQDALIEDDDEDEHEEKLVRHVKATKDASSLTESAAIEKNPAEHHASDHALFERTWKTHIEGKRTRDDRSEQNQIGKMLSGKDASSSTKSLGIEKPTQFVFENHSSELNFVEKHSHQDVLRTENNLHELDEPQVAKPGKEYSNGTAPINDASSLTESPEQMQLDSEISGKHYAFDHEGSEEESKLQFVEVHVQQEISKNDAVVEKPSKEVDNGTNQDAIAEQLESVQISSTPSLSTFTQVGNDESLSVYTPNFADLKTFYETGPTKVSGDPLSKNSFDNVKGTLKQNIENTVKSSVYRDRKAGTLLKEIPESSSKRSPAYDGSVSSFDGNDDKVAELPQLGEQTLSPNNVVAGSVGAEKSPECGSLPSERMIFGNVRPSRQARSSSTTVLDEKFKSRMIEEEAPLERNEIPRRFKLNSENFLPRGSNRRRSSELTYETGSTSSHALHDEPPRHQMHPRHPCGRRFPESPLWREKEFLPMYYNSETSGEYYDRPKHHSYMDRRRRTESWSQSGTLPRNPYSREIFSGRYPYMHRYPEDRRWSAQLPPPSIYFRQGGYMNPNWETRWDPYDSYPTSPQHFMESEASYAWPHDTASLSDDPRHKDQIMRQMYLREKRQAVKTPFRPIAGGTPFITCYFCFNILQLPEDFLSRRRRQRRIHKLKCGACSSVLEFSLENEGGLSPCETNLNRNVNLAMSSHSHANHSRHSCVSSADSRILLSRDSFRASNRAKRMSRDGSSSKGEKMEGLHDDDDDDDDDDDNDNDDDAPPSRGRSSKVTWIIPARSKSPLHKLLGYSSPNEMLANHDADDIE